MNKIEKFDELVLEILNTILEASRDLIDPLKFLSETKNCEKIEEYLRVHRLVDDEYNWIRILYEMILPYENDINESILHFWKDIKRMIKAIEENQLENR